MKQDLQWFLNRVGKKILRGTTVIEVTDKNYNKLYNIQTDSYTFKDI